MSERRVAVFLSHSDPTALRLAASCTLTASSICDRVDVFLLGPAVKVLLDAFRAESAGEPDPGEAAHELLRSRSQGVRLVACSASVVEDRIELEEIEQAVDAVVGWPTIVEWTRGVVDRFFF